MKLNQKLTPRSHFTFIILLLSATAINSYAQETIDTLLLKTVPSLYKASFLYDQYLQRQTRAFNFDDSELLMKQSFDQKGINKAAYGHHVFLSSSVYHYEKGGCSFVQISDPLNMQMQFSFKEQYGWEKF